MEKFEIYETVQQDEETDQTETTGQDPEKISVEKIKKLQLILIAEQFLFYSVLFDFLGKYLMDKKLRDERDVERGVVREPNEQFSDISPWARIYNSERKTFFGKTIADWLDLALWIGLIIAVTVSSGAILYLYIKNQTSQVRV